MKKKNVYPEWAEKFRAKGKTIRKVRNGYGLYECTSTYVPGQKYPKSAQKYLGMITEKDGFIPKKSVSDTASFSIEYGLSHFIISNFRRDLQRSVFNSDMAVVVLGIIFYIFGSIDPAFLSSSYLSIHFERDIVKIADSASVRRVKAVSNKISALLKEKIPDENDRILLTGLLLLCTISDKNSPDTLAYPETVTELAERYGLKL